MEEQLMLNIFLVNPITGRMDVVDVDERSKINEWFTCQLDITISTSFQGRRISKALSRFPDIGCAHPVRRREFYRSFRPAGTNLAGLELPPEKSPTKNSGRATAKPGDRGDAVLCPARSNPHDDEDEEEDEQQQ
ncbi:hypothetical protein V1478_007208 [Vespula squamosa]|uniref:Uncharacterized protein n=1 Tax=Vespula squamosa TaxID=30214 RepID=A0ABD2B2J1_VESSQ